MSVLDCDDENKLVVAPVFNSRLEESSERTTRNSRTWSLSGGFRALTMSMPTVTTASGRETLLVIIYILTGIVIVIATIVLIRSFVYGKRV